jgi:flagellar FliJ protein
MVEYRFNLQSLLDHKRNVEEISQKRLFEVENSLNKEKAILTCLIEKRTVLSTEINRKAEKMVTIAEKDLYRAYLKDLHQDIQRQQDITRLVEENLQEKRNELIQVMQERKVLEKLKEKKKIQHFQGEAQQEQNFLNEVGLSRFRNNNQHDQDEG